MNPLSSHMYICAKALFQNTGSHGSRQHDHSPVSRHAVSARADPRRQPGFTAPPQHATSQFTGTSCLLLLHTTQSHTYCLRSVTSRLAVPLPNRNTAIPKKGIATNRFRHRQQLSDCQHSVQWGFWTGTVIPILQTGK